MASFDEAERQIQARADAAREEQREKLWRTQCLPKFANGGLNAKQIEVAKATFCSGFDVGWESHQAFLMGEFIRDNQKKKVHLA
jgi:hypothetical protein